MKDRDSKKFLFAFHCCIAAIAFEKKQTRISFNRHKIFLIEGKSEHVDD